MNAYDLSDLALMFRQAREQQPGGATGNIQQGSAAPSPTIDEYLGMWAASPENFPDGTVRVYRGHGRDYLTGSDALLNAIEALRDLTKLPTYPVPIHDDNPEFMPLTREDAVASLRAAGITR